MRTNPLRATSPAQTFAVGRGLGGLLRGGEFIALSGPLGAGKTQFVKGLAAGLGVPEDEPVVSPTFVLVREYAGEALTLFHIDAYRLSSAEELLALGLEEMRSPDSVVAVEWADRTPDAIPPDACRIELAHAGATERTIEIAWDGAGDRLDQIESMVGR